MSTAPPVVTGTPCGYCGQRSSTLVPRGDKWACLPCFLAHPANMYELAARVKRAIALTDVLLQLGGDPAAARSMSEADWELAANAAKIGKAPSLETRELVLRTLEDYRRNSNV